MIDHQRRAFLRSAGLASFSVGLANTVASINARAADLDQAFDLLKALYLDPVTLQYVTLGMCCWYCPDRVIVTHYQPVAYIEVIRSATDNALFPTSIGQGSTQSTIVSGHSYQAFEARMFDIPSWVVDGASGYQGCKFCGPKRVPKHLNFPEGGICRTGDVMKKILTEVNGLLPDCVPQLLYDSQLDRLAWRTGCQDVLSVNAMKAPATCNGSSAFLKDECLGIWGPKFPRQMAKIDEDPRRAAHVTGLRALSHAADMGLTPFSGDSRLGKLQPILPERGIGFPPGTELADKEMKRLGVSKNGVYAFIWWLPAVCCKSYEKIWGLCIPEIPCVTSGY